MKTTNVLGAFQNREQTITVIRKKVRNDRLLPIREVTNGFGVFVGSCHSIRTDESGTERISVTITVNRESNGNRIEMCSKLNNRFANNPNCMKSIITGDEMWLYVRYTNQT